MPIAQASVVEQELRERLGDFETSTNHHPWFVVPADNKWFTRLVASAAINDALDSMKLDFAVLDAARRTEIERCRRELRGI